MLKDITFKPFPNNEYPFNINCIKKLKKLDLSNPITVFVGDNGSGKSTLLKAIAYYNDSINVSSQSIDSNYYIDSVDLAKHMKCSYDVKTKKGFFFSGEEFITYINHIKHMKQDLRDDLARIEVEYKNRSTFARNQARMAPAGQLSALEHSYDGDLKEKSHGEGFISFFKERMHQKGLYLLDEPETPLSPINQYKLVVMITDLVKSGSQVIIATHSPIIMALKGATIYQFGDEIDQVNYEDIESVNFMRYFLNNKDSYIDRI